MSRRIAPLVAWLAFLAAALLGLHALGGGTLATPPLGDLTGWLSRVGSAAAAFAVLRLVALVLGWYLLGATMLALGLRVLQAHRAAAGVEATTPAFVRRLVRGAVGLTIAAGAMTSVAAADDGAVTMRRLPDEPAVVPVEMRRLDDDPPVTMRRMDDDGAPAQALTHAPAAGSTWTVRPGESFWAVAEHVLTGAWSQAPTDDQIDPYWRALVEANRQRLADPGNPDLLFPDQVLDLPPPPPRPAPGA